MPSPFTPASKLKRFNIVLGGEGVILWDDSDVSIVTTRPIDEIESLRHHAQRLNDEVDEPSSSAYQRYLDNSIFGH